MDFIFCTGFCAMAMEAVRTRIFTPVLKTQVYSFALGGLRLPGRDAGGLNFIPALSLKKARPENVAVVDGAAGHRRISRRFRRERSSFRHDGHVLSSIRNSQRC